MLTYNYSSGLNDSISRLSSLSDSGGTLESYDYLGYGIVVRRAHTQPNVDLSYIKRSGESNADAGDQYIGLDRFGRVVDQRWMDATSGTAKDRFQYTYDALGNRTARDNLVNSSFDEDYTYDALNQLASYTRGSDSQSWDYDALGNWDSITTNGTAQTRSANKQNEITSISSATTPTYDANGNMTGDETGKQFVYDAWNRLVEVKNSGGTSLKTYKYDGLTRRVSETASGTTTDLYYSSAWQVLEERVSGNTTKRYVWSPVYVDAMVLRDRDTDANGSLDERLYVLHDANFNVTALLDTSGNVVERYAYTPFGVQNVYDASWSVRSGGTAYDFHHSFQGMRYDVVAGLNPQRYRWYSPTLGRWVTMDPIRYQAGDMVLYRAMGNNTVNGVDPSGLESDNLQISVGTTQTVTLALSTTMDQNRKTIEQTTIAGMQATYLLAVKTALALRVYSEAMCRNSMSQSTSDYHHSKFLTKVETLLKKYFSGDGKMPSCKCIKELSVRAQKIVDGLKNTKDTPIKLSYHQDPVGKGTLGGRTVVNHHDIQLVNVLSATTADYVDVFYHELSHLYSGTTDAGGGYPFVYYTSGNADTAVWQVRVGSDFGKQVFPSTEEKCQNASALHSFARAVAGLPELSDVTADKHQSLPKQPSSKLWER